MRPTLLKPGMKVLVVSFGGPDREMNFVQRDRYNRLNIFQCDDYRGLDGPNDKGICTMSDYRVVHDVRRKGAA